MWPQFERKPIQVQNEQVICVVTGKEEFKIASGIFRQYLYVGVFDELEIDSVPEEINFFDIDKEKYSLVNQLSETGAIQTTVLNAGDCMYLPSFYFWQSRTHMDDTTMLSF
jgi:hypothetical protein